jgi:hypothetical protein
MHLDGESGALQAPEEGGVVAVLHRPGGDDRGWQLHRVAHQEDLLTRTLHLPLQRPSWHMLLTLGPSSHTAHLFQTEYSSKQ